MSSNANSLDVIIQHLQESSNVKSALIKQSNQIANIADCLCNVLKNSGRIYSCGNGGSSCDAMHLTEELVARYSRERPGIPAFHLCDTSVMSCWSNDYEFNTVFSRQVSTFVGKNDALIGFSTSGNSENIILAIEAANSVGAQTILLTGKDGGKAKSIAKHSLIVESGKTAHIQEAHIAVVHVLCGLIENYLYPPK